MWHRQATCGGGGGAAVLLRSYAASHRMSSRSSQAFPLIWLYSGLQQPTMRCRCRCCCCCCCCGIMFISLCVSCLLLLSAGSPCLRSLSSSILVTTPRPHTSRWLMCRGMTPRASYPAAAAAQQLMVAPQDPSRWWLCATCLCCQVSAATAAAAGGRRQ